MVIEIQAQMKLQWLTFQDPASGRWIAVCDPLKITVGADKWGELAENIDDSLLALIVDLYENNEFDEFMRKRGWKLMNPMPAKIDENVRFDIPMDIQRMHARDYQNATA